MKMKKLKKAICTLSVLFAIGMGSISFGQNAIEELQLKDLKAGEYDFQQGIKEMLEGQGTVKEIKEEQILVQFNNQIIGIHISENTIWIDGETGKPSEKQKLEEGDKVYVYYSPILTRSLPAQSNGFGIVTNYDAEKSMGKWFQVKEVISQTENQIQALNQEEDLIVTITKESEITSFKTKQMISYNDIRKGALLFVWYDIVALSYPGQTYGQKVVLIHQQQDDGVPTEIRIRNTKLDLGKEKILKEKEHIILPLRLVAEKLGFELTWNSEEKTVLLDNGSVNSIVTLGKDAYFKGSPKAVDPTKKAIGLGIEPLLVEGTLYVPIEYFSLLCNDPDIVKIEGSKIQIETRE